MTTATVICGTPDLTQEQAGEQVNSLFEMDQRKNEFLATLATGLQGEYGQPSIARLEAKSR